MIRKVQAFALILLLIPAASGSLSATALTSVVENEAIEKYVRTELYFGMAKGNGGTVTDEEWQRFVDEFVTPRFPEGLTIIDADGRWRNEEGKLIREGSRIMLLFYSRKDRRAANTRIEEIRAEYKKRFDQRSVLRLDLRTWVNVSF